MTDGERIRDERIKQKLTQDELATKAGYKNRSAISDIEKAETLTLKKVEKIAKALHVSAAYLMGWEDSEDTYYSDPDAASYAQYLKDNPDYRVLFDAVRNVSPEDIDTVRRLLDVYRKQ